MRMVIERKALQWEECWQRNSTRRPSSKHNTSHAQLEEVVKPTYHSAYVFQVGWQPMLPEQAAGKADGKGQPDLVKALLGSRQ